MIFCLVVYVHQIGRGDQDASGLHGGHGSQGDVVLMEVVMVVVMFMTVLMVWREFIVK